MPDDERAAKNQPADRDRIDDPLTDSDERIGTGDQAEHSGRRD